MRKILCALFILCIAAFYLSGGDWASCSSFNRNTDGVSNYEVAQYDEWIYYINHNDARRIYKMRSDESVDEIFHYENINCFKILDGWIYFSNYNDGGRLYKMRLDRSGETRLSMDFARNIEVSEGWVYYKSDDGLYRVRSDGSGRTKLYNCYGELEMQVYGSRIYLADHHNSETGWSIYSMKVDGSNLIRLNTHASSSINVSGNWIYYINGSDRHRIYRMRTNGTCVEKLCEDTAYDLNVAGDWLYYNGQDDKLRGKRVHDFDGGKALYRLRLNGGGKQRISENGGGNINVSGEWVFFKDGPRYLWWTKMKIR